MLLIAGSLGKIRSYTSGEGVTCHYANLGNRQPSGEPRARCCEAARQLICDICNSAAPVQQTHQLKHTNHNTAPKACSCSVKYPAFTVLYTVSSVRCYFGDCAAALRLYSVAATASPPICILQTSLCASFCPPQPVRPTYIWGPSHTCCSKSAGTALQSVYLCSPAHTLQTLEAAGSACCSNNLPQ
jgi:hypothetical protein